MEPFSNKHSIPKYISPIWLAMHFLPPLLYLGFLAQIGKVIGNLKVKQKLPIASEKVKIPIYMSSKWTSANHSYL